MFRDSKSSWGLCFKEEPSAILPQALPHHIWSREGCFQRKHQVLLLERKVGWVALGWL